MKKTKKELIGYINAIIEDFGSFSCADVEATSSPVINTLGRDTCLLAENFYKDKVEAVIYVHDNETSTDYIRYEDLDLGTLEEIHTLALVWVELNN